MRKTKTKTKTPLHQAFLSHPSLHIVALLLILTLTFTFAFAPIYASSFSTPPSSSRSSSLDQLGSDEENVSLFSLQNYVERLILEGDASWRYYDTIQDSDDHVLVVDEYVFIINVTGYEFDRETQVSEDVFIQYYLAKGNLEVIHSSGWHVSVPLPTMKLFVLIFARSILNCHINPQMQLVAMTPTNTFTTNDKEKNFTVYVAGEPIIDVTGSFLIINYLQNNILLFRKEWNENESSWVHYVDVYSFEGEKIATMNDYYENGTIRLTHSVTSTKESVELYVLEGEEWRDIDTIVASDNSSMGVYVSPLGENYSSAFVFDNTYSALGFECPSIFSLVTIPNATLATLTQTPTTNTSVVYLPEFSFPPQKLFGLLSHSFSSSFKIKLADEIYFDLNSKNLHVVNPDPRFSIKYTYTNSSLTLMITFDPTNETITVTLPTLSPPPPKVLLSPVNHYLYGVVITSDRKAPYKVKTITGETVKMGILNAGSNIVYLPDGWYILEVEGVEKGFIVTGMLSDTLRSNLPAFAQWSINTNAKYIAIASIITIALTIATRKPKLLLLIPLTITLTPIIHFFTLQPLLAIL